MTDNELVGATTITLPSGLQVTMGKRIEGSMDKGRSSQVEVPALRIGDYQSTFGITDRPPRVVTRENGVTELNYLNIDRLESFPSVKWTQILLQPSSDPHTALFAGNRTPGRHLYLIGRDLIELGLAQALPTSYEGVEALLTASDGEIATTLGAHQNELMSKATPFSLSYLPIYRDENAGAQSPHGASATLAKDASYSICQEQPKQQTAPVASWEHCQTQAGTTTAEMFEKVRPVPTPTGLSVNLVKSVSANDTRSFTSLGLLTGDYFLPLNQRDKVIPPILPQGEDGGFALRYWSLQRHFPTASSFQQVSFGPSVQPKEAVDRRNGADNATYSADAELLIELGLAQQLTDESGKPTTVSWTASDEEIKAALLSNIHRLHRYPLPIYYVPQGGLVSKECEEEVLAKSYNASRAKDQ